jgi:acylphosphatase
MRRVRVVVTGRVQGVFFRVGCAERARSAGVCGWVRNTAGGSVEAVFEGPDDAVAGMVDWCREGPAGATVTGVEVADLDPVGDRGFRIEGPPS